METLREDFIDELRLDRRFADDAARERVMVAHRRAVDLGLSTYRDPLSGYSVMTAVYLADRGYCCSSGCRHCPYA